MKKDRRCFIGPAALAVAMSVSAAKAETVEVRSGVNECIVVWTGASGRQEINTGIPAPCAIHKTLKGELRVYRDGNRSVVLIETSVPDPSRGEKSCITQIRGLAYDAQSATLSKHISRVASCPPFQWDQKMFTALF